MATLVAIDPGHGVTTPGKRSPEALGLPVLREYAFNRDIATRLEEELNRMGVTSMRTVSTDIDLTSRDRLDAAQLAGCKLFLSLHANAGGGTGIETYYTEGNPSSERLARLVHTSVIFATGAPSRGRKTADFWVTREAPRRGMTACLIELGFMDDPTDLAKLRAPAYRSACALGIARGIALYLGIV